MFCVLRFLVYIHINNKTQYLCVCLTLHNHLIVHIQACTHEFNVVVCSTLLYDTRSPLSILSLLIMFIS